MLHALHLTIEEALYALPARRSLLIWHKDQGVKLLKDGSLEINFPVSDFSEIKREILKHDDMVEVIRPKSLRELIKAEAQKIAKIY